MGSLPLFFCLENAERHAQLSLPHAIASEATRLRVMPAATSFLSSFSGRKMILWPLIIDAGEKSLAAIVSAL